MKAVPEEGPPFCLFRMRKREFPPLLPGVFRVRLLQERVDLSGRTGTQFGRSRYHSGNKVGSAFRFIKVWDEQLK